jgi:hypothetical protein
MKAATLEELSVYLPYKLKYIHKGNMAEMKSVDFGVQLVNMGWGNALETHELKPIVRPLSDLTKPIVVEGYNDGKEFIPINQLEKLEGVHWLWGEIECRILEPEQLPYIIVTMLAKWHFDMFGWIESEAGIDINTLKP